MLLRRGTVDAFAEAMALGASSMPPRLESQLVEMLLLLIVEGDEGDLPTPKVAAVDTGAW